MPTQSNDDGLEREVEELRAALRAARDDNRQTEERLAIMLDSLKGAVERSKAVTRRQR